MSLDHVVFVAKADWVIGEVKLLTRVSGVISFTNIAFQAWASQATDADEELEANSSSDEDQMLGSEAIK